MGNRQAVDMLTTEVGSVTADFSTKTPGTTTLQLMPKLPSADARAAVDRGVAGVDAAAGVVGDGRRRRPGWLRRWEVATAADGTEGDGCGRNRE